MTDVRLAFIRQQGFDDVAPETCDLRYSALMLQPRILGPAVVIGVLLQSAALFAVLGVVLLWSALLPSFNPFDALHNLFARRRRRPPLGPAPPPRRFAQAMASAMALTIALSLAIGWHTAAWIVEAMLLAALVALVFGSFCLGSYVYHLLFRRSSRHARIAQ